MAERELPVVIRCGTDRLVGICHEPSTPLGTTVVVVVGGPQYRIGSHRQFVVTARAMARSGAHVLRFDLPGMGDSDGEAVDFTATGEAIEAAVSWAENRYQGNRTVLYGLCDGVSASLLSVERLGTERVHGMICVNPWVRQATTEARARTRHYYAKRLLSAEFWRKLVRFQVALGQSVGELGATLKQGLTPAGEQADFVAGMYHGLAISTCPVLFMLSGEDLTAREFDGLVKSKSRWRKILNSARVTVGRLAVADHTFSDRALLDEHDHQCCRWLNTLSEGAR